MQAIFHVLVALMILLNLCSAYLAVTALFVFKKHTPYQNSEPTTRFAVIIPARNEAHVLPNIIRALRSQNYPSELIDIYVASNHCTDDTAQIARKLGAEVIACADSVRCKGDVLHEAVCALLPQPYDAYAVFDADNLPAPDFMQRMNDALNAGERVCRGRLKAGNALESWVSGDYGLYHALMEWTYSRPHTNAGFSSNLVGTAFVIHREVFEAMDGWNTSTICEDSEFAAQCSQMGYRVAFIPEALSYDEQVASFGISLRQRRRWCYGMIQAARKMLPDMFSSKCPKKGMARDFGMLFLISHTAPLATIAMLLSLPFQPRGTLWIVPISLALSWVGVTLLAIPLCWLGGYPTRKMWKAILLHPIFMVSWAPLQVLALFVPVNTWSPIPHNGQSFEGLNSPAE